jgi:hypothetical protein
MKRFTIIYLVLITTAMVSCKKDPHIGGTAAEKIANEWWVTLTQNGNDVFGIGHFHLSTYNTSANDTTIWVDDEKNGYGFKAKAKADFDNLNFMTSGNASNLYYNPSSPTAFPQSVAIQSGKILPNAAHSKAGNTTDSLYMKIQFSDDPANTYVISGYARTRFAEDDY